MKRSLPASDARHDAAGNGLERRDEELSKCRVDGIPRWVALGGRVGWFRGQTFALQPEEGSGGWVEEPAV